MKIRSQTVSPRLVDKVMTFIDVHELTEFRAICWIPRAGDDEGPISCVVFSARA